MHYMGIDYGEKKLGIAVSDENAKMAFPKTIIKNDAELIMMIGKICKEENIGTIIIGESKNEKGGYNAIMDKIFSFKKVL